MCRSSNRITTLASSSDAGFSMLELLTTISIIGVLAVVAIQNLAEYKLHAQVASAAREIRDIATAFEAYNTDNEAYPDDSHLNLPPGMETLINPSLWSQNTPIGGNYNWEGLDGYSYAGISIFNSGADNDTFSRLDRMIDDGNLFTGRFQVMSNGRPTFMLDGVPG